MFCSLAVIDAMQGMHACLPLQLVAQTCKCLRDRILKTLTSAIVMSSMIPADVDVRVTELLAGASTGDKLVNTVHQIMVLLRENGLVTSMRLLPSAVGVHPKNRDGAGLNSADVHTLLSNLLEVGFVAERTRSSLPMSKNSIGTISSLAVAKASWAS